MLNNYFVLYCNFVLNPVFEHSDTPLLGLVACIILHINGKQFRCSVFTFDQYITYYGDYWPETTSNGLVNRCIFLINWVSYVHSTDSNTPPLKRTKNVPKFHLITEKHSKKHQVEILSKILQLFLPTYRKVQEKITWTDAPKVIFSRFLLMRHYFSSWIYFPLTCTPFVLVWLSSCIYFPLICNWLSSCIYFPLICTLFIFA